MPLTVDELVALLDLERLEEDLFRGNAPETSLQRTFGGQVAAQALMAAGRTLAPLERSHHAKGEPIPSPDRRVHSLHAYFLRPGDASTPIVYQVERMRDGRAFSARRTIGIQHGQRIFALSASFQVPEAGLDHQHPMPSVAPAESLPTMEERLGQRPASWAALWREWEALDVRHVAATPWSAATNGADGQPRAQVWVRAAGSLPHDPLLHACVLAYASDLTLLSSTLMSHEVRPSQVQMASIDHAMWFHRPFRADEWLLYEQASPSASGGRGLGTGAVFTAEGSLVASVVQEGLIRPAPARPVG